VLLIVIASSLLMLLGLPIIIMFHHEDHISHWEIFMIIGVLPLIGFLFAISLSWMSNLVNSVYRCALYIYATEGVVPGTFDKELLDSAWKVK
jgi:hypothetical protein